jgi:hypothetical protein
LVAVGNRTGETGANNIAIGQYSPGAGVWIVLLDSSPSYYEGYGFTFDGFNLVEGIETTYSKFYNERVSCVATRKGLRQWPSK